MNATSSAGVVMVEFAFSCVWNWDARPFPVFRADPAALTRDLRDLSDALDVGLVAVHVPANSAQWGDTGN